ncbi:DUF397 domain-containing protein [Streptosporangium sp. NPDC001559]|uniref:DUF397 domain-containing protein n=1 Tax=Streptosporangium sp. NPDC001559 TaxID=3366187 RepID=UPI0036EA5DEF
MQQPNPPDGLWRKSSLSADGPSCVEVAFIDDTVTVRDTKDRKGGALTFHHDTWTTFVNDIKQGGFDDLALR